MITRKTGLWSAVALSGLYLAFSSAPSALAQGAFETKAMMTPTDTVPVGVQSTIQITVKSHTILSEGVLDVEIYNAAGEKVGQFYFDNLSFNLEQSRDFAMPWTPAKRGSYLIKTGIFNKTWETLYFWNNLSGGFTAVTDNAIQYDFEDGIQGWLATGGMISGLAPSTNKAFDGLQSLAIGFSGSAGEAQNVFVLYPSTQPMATVTFRVWYPADSKLIAIQPFVQQGLEGNYAWTGNFYGMDQLTPDAWNAVTVTVPPDALTPLLQIGVQFITGDAWTGVCYLDTVTW